MPFLIRNIPLDLSGSEEELRTEAAKRLGVPPSAIRQYSVVQRSLDARGDRFGPIHYVYQVELILNETASQERRRARQIRSTEIRWFQMTGYSAPETGREPMPQRPVVIGFGPAGMFAALRLAKFGYKPIVFERGRDVRRRHRDVMHRFYRLGEFDPTSNLLFGEGGAGTYSDGKLYTRIRDPLCREVLEAFYHHGADPDILIDSHPHIGSDRLPTICTRIRRTIESLGGEVRFEQRLEDIQFEGEPPNLTTVKINNVWSPAGPTILAVGHSARDTMRTLALRGVRIDPKPFQIGVRIEHPQEMVDRWQYGPSALDSRLPPAEYHLVARKAGGAQGDLFSFCMCPGGIILPTNESPGLIATNGASRSKRSGRFANSGLVITLDPVQLGMTALDALAYQEWWERLAFQTTGATYRVPAQRASDFLSRTASQGMLDTSYPLGGTWSDLRSILPDTVTEALERGLPRLEARYAGFAGPSALLTAPETRASAPVRITRDPQTRQAIGHSNLYPVGEGAGYAGGIISAAVDGIKTADAIIARFAPCA